jgi:hypothetical protein
MSGRAPVAVGLVLGALVATCAVAAATIPPRADPGPQLPVSGPGDPTVSLSRDAAVHPEGADVRNLLQRHFDAINSRNYPGWQGTVVPERVRALPEPAFRTVYASTQDGTIRVDRIEDGPALASGFHDLVVRFRFVSVQSLDAAPQAVRAERICWNSSLPLVGYPRRIGQTGGGSSLPRAC